MPTETLKTPLGPITITETRGAVVRAALHRDPGSDDTPLLRAAKSQLSQSFAPKRETLNLPLSPAGTDFERAVWHALLRIPSRSTRTYEEISVDIHAIARAVGRASGSNPIPIIIPCHRVVAAHGLGGLSAGSGAPTKRTLLTVEQPDLFSSACSTPLPSNSSQRTHSSVEG